MKTNIELVKSIFSIHESIDVKELDEIDVDGLKAIEIDGWITLTPAEGIESVSSILGNCIKKVTVWNVEKTVFYPGTYDDPPDSDTLEIATNLSFDNACRKALNLWMDNWVDTIMENAWDEQTAEEWGN